LIEILYKLLRELQLISRDLMEEGWAFTQIAEGWETRLRIDEVIRLLIPIALSLANSASLSLNPKVIIVTGLAC
jgi:hypothetical protein